MRWLLPADSIQFRTATDASACHRDVVGAMNHEATRLDEPSRCERGNAVPAPSENQRSKSQGRLLALTIHSAGTTQLGLAIASGSVGAPTSIGRNMPSIAMCSTSSVKGRESTPNP